MASAEGNEEVDIVLDNVKDVDMVDVDAEESDNVR